MDYLGPAFVARAEARPVGVHSRQGPDSIRKRHWQRRSDGGPVQRHDDAAAFVKHGFNFLGRITIDTDVVRENAQTYRLGWSENAKDSTKMGVGMPEYVLLFRKPHTDLSAAYADLPVTKDKEVYTRAHWQVDAAGFWKSDGNRLPDPEILAAMPMEDVRKLWIEHAKKHGYDGRSMLRLRRSWNSAGICRRAFMLFPPVSNHPGVWTDIVRMRVLNSEQSRRNQEHHVCPLQLDIVNRLIGRYSNPGEIVLDPFAGISPCRIARFIWGASAGALNSRTIIGGAGRDTASRRSASIACRRCLTPMQRDGYGLPQRPCSHSNGC
jgi:hypothetical protein